jgi:hypothetical protein
MTNQSSNDALLAAIRRLVRWDEFIMGALAKILESAKACPSLSS